MSTEPKHTLVFSNWSLGNVTRTLYKDNVPTGTEFKVYNLAGGDPQELVDQANCATKLKQERDELLAALNDLMPLVQSYRDTIRQTHLAHLLNEQEPGRIAAARQAIANATT